MLSYPRVQGALRTPSDTVHAAVLDGIAGKVYAVPAGATTVVFVCATNFYAKFGSSSGVTGVLPTSDIVDGTACELNPTGRQLGDGATHIFLIAPAAAIVTMSFYRS